MVTAKSFASVVVSVALLDFIAVGEEAGHVAPEQGCTLTVKACLNFPDFNRIQFRDTMGEQHLEAATNEAACLKRAEDLHHWCGNDMLGGAQVAATFNPKRWTQVFHSGACDKGWSQWDAFCYKYYWEMRTWYEAEKLCRDRDAHLASVHSQAENRYIATLSWGLKAWLGYQDIDKDTHYQWTDNTQDDFTNFAKNCSGREHEPDCQKEEVAQQWYSSKGTDTSPFVCKRNALLPLALLRNTSAEHLINTSWILLLPGLAGGSAETAHATSADGASPAFGVPSLKTQEILNARPGDIAASTQKELAQPKPHVKMPKGSLF